MPNGFYVSKDEWERMVAPLRELDASLERFAGEHGMVIVQNYHNMPNRMLHWTPDGIERVIQITLYAGDERLIQFSYSAFRDHAGSRHGKRWPAAAGIPLEEFKRNMDELLEQARTTLATVSVDDLEYWTYLS